ncbi:DinB family protein [Edaphobacter bradus]|uniref:DinB family protein n=1 Tax=Edaphobacter bradus TaxID=2259016 RepID=UPI0021DF4384|nr:DinB family protein [Edaphobacter bradus]
MEERKIEPWLRGTRTEVDAMRRGVIHALELAAEDMTRWSEGLSDEEIEARPMGLTSVGFHLRHIARSLDRLLTYAEGQQLSERQLKALRSEMEPGAGREAALMEFAEAIEVAVTRVLKIMPGSFEEARGVGKKMLPTTVGGLLVHCADHTQRHVGQVVTTVKALRGVVQKTTSI